MTETTIDGASFFRDGATDDGGAFLASTPEIQMEFELTPEDQERYELKQRGTESTKRDTKTIGDISEAQVIPAMRKLGFDVSLPFGADERHEQGSASGQ